MSSVGSNCSRVNASMDDEGVKCEPEIDLQADTFAEHFNMENIEYVEVSEDGFLMDTSGSMQPSSSTVMQAQAELHSSKNCSYSKSSPPHSPVSSAISSTTSDDDSDSAMCTKRCKKKLEHHKRLTRIYKEKNRRLLKRVCRLQQQALRDKPRAKSASTDKKAQTVGPKKKYRPNLFALSSNAGDADQKDSTNINGIQLTQFQKSLLNTIPTDKSGDIKFVNALLMAVFGVEVLRTSSITGLAKGDITKSQLDQRKLHHIRELYSNRFMGQSDEKERMKAFNTIVNRKIQNLRRPDIK